MARHSASRGGVRDRRISDRAGVVPALRDSRRIRNSRSLSLFHPAVRPVDRRRLVCFCPSSGRGPLVFAVAVIGALSCLYIAGEEMSWGQHFFHWNTPEYWAMVNRQAGNQSAQHLRHLREDAALDPRSGYLHRRLAGAARRAVLAVAARLPRLAVPARGGARADGARRVHLQARSTGSSRADISATLLLPAERDDRDLSLFLYPRLSHRLRAPHQGARSGGRRLAEIVRL